MGSFCHPEDIAAAETRLSWQIVMVNSTMPRLAVSPWPSVTYHIIVWPSSPVDDQRVYLQMPGSVSKGATESQKASRICLAGATLG